MRNDGLISFQKLSEAVLVGAVCLFFFGTASGSPGQSVAPGEAEILKTLRPGHPRLIVLDADLARIKRSIETDATAKRYYERLLADGERILAEPPVKHVLIGPRLLDKSRRVVDRIYTLGLLHRLDGQKKWADRAIAELLVVSAFNDWNPSHFLDVAEMTHGVAIGYDWFYDSLTAEQRKTVERALVEKGLREAEKAHRRNAAFLSTAFNWNNVCNGGITVGALAVADEEPKLSGFLLAQATQKLPRALGSYAPDGAWAEGPGYWGYATRYTIYGFAAMQSALGTDFGMSGLPGFSKAGFFRLQATGPTSLLFNFADCGETAGDDPSLFWLARRYDLPVLAAAGRAAAKDSISPWDLIWLDERGSENDLRQLPLDARFQAANVAFFRSAWLDTNAVLVGFKGGDNKANHAHLDLGTFVLDAAGERWACDLGGDEYNMPGYFGAQRWTYYRLKSEGHNTLVFNATNQDTKAAAPITQFESTRDGGFAIADLTQAYASAGVTRVWRGIALRDQRSRVLVQDEIERAKPAPVTWSMHTRAAVTLKGQGATLKKNGKMLEARILSPADATFAFEEVDLRPPQHPSKGVGKLLIQLPPATGVERVAVLLTPGADRGDDVKLVPLAQWGR